MAVAGLLHPAKRRRHIDRAITIHIDHAGLHAGDHPVCAPEIGRPYPSGQTVIGGVGKTQRVGLVPEGGHRQHRPEYLVAEQIVRGRHRRDHGRFHIEAAAVRMQSFAAALDPASLLAGTGQRRHVLVQLRGAVDRPDVIADR